MLGGGASSDLGADLGVDSVGRGQVERRVFMAGFLPVYGGAWTASSLRLDHTAQMQINDWAPEFFSAINQHEQEHDP